MSKSFIVYLVIVAVIIVASVFGFPYMQNTLKLDQEPHLTVTDIDNPGSSAEEIVVGEFKPLSYDELNEREKAFVHSVRQDRGVYKYGDLVVLSFGEQRTLVSSVQYVGQEVQPNEVRIYLDIKEDRSSSTSEEFPIFIGKITVPQTMIVSFYDYETKTLIN